MHLVREACGVQVFLLEDDVISTHPEKELFSKIHSMQEACE